MSQNSDPCINFLRKLGVYFAKRVWICIVPIPPCLLTNPFKIKLNSSLTQMCLLKLGSAFSISVITSQNCIQLSKSSSQTYFYNERINWIVRFCAQSRRDCLLTSKLLVPLHWWPPYPSRTQRFSILLLHTVPVFRKFMNQITNMVPNNFVWMSVLKHTDCSTYTTVFFSINKNYSISFF